MATITTRVAAVLIALTSITAPAIAHDTHPKSHRGVENSYASVSSRHVARKARCTRAPDVGAFATQPWTKPPCEPASTY